MGIIRYTYTGKWEEDWYVNLPVELKMLYEYLTSVCNHAGIWKVSSVMRRNAETLIGYKYDWENIFEKFNEAKEVIVLTEKGDWFLIDHLHNTHRGGIRPNNRVTKSIVDILKDEGVWEAYCQVSGVKVDVQEPEEVKVGRRKSKINTNRITTMFNELWKEYPSMGGRSNPQKTALDEFAKIIRVDEDPEGLFKKIMFGLKVDKKNMTNPQFVPQTQRWIKERRWDGIDEGSGKPTIYTVKQRG